MSRPKPHVLLSRPDPKKSFRTDQVLAASAIYAVFFDGQPINLRTLDATFDGAPKYKKCAFPNPGHAFNLAERLNRAFRTNQFQVMKLTKGEKIDEISEVQKD